MSSWLPTDQSKLDTGSIKGPLPYLPVSGDPIIGAAPEDLKQGQQVNVSSMIFYMGEDVTTGSLLTVGPQGTLIRARPIA